MKNLTQILSSELTLIAAEREEDSYSYHVEAKLGEMQMSAYIQCEFEKELELLFLDDVNGEHQVVVNSEIITYDRLHNLIELCKEDESILDTYRNLLGRIVSKVEKEFF